MSCERVQRRVDETLLAGQTVADADRLHLERCPVCGAHARFVHELGAELASAPAPTLAPAALAATRARAVAALHEQVEWHGFVRDLVRAVVVALVALPVTVAHGVLVARGAWALFGGWLPTPVLDWLGLVYFGSVALAIGVLYGSLPLAVAFSRRARWEPA